MKKTFFIAGLVFLAFFMSCEYNKFSPPQGLKPAKDTTHQVVVDTTHKDTTLAKSPCSPDTVYFTNTIFPLIVSSCALTSCHDAITRHSGYNFTTYAGIMAAVRAGYPTSSRLYTQLTSTKKRMPKAKPLTTAQIAEIGTWITQGAKNNTCTDNTICDSVNVGFAANITPILSANCTGCHGASIASGGIRLDSYTGVSVVVQNGQLLKAVTGAITKMPLYGTPLSPCDIGKIRQWINGGAMNN